jgi:hypothetical protein
LPETVVTVTGLHARAAPLLVKETVPPSTVVPVAGVTVAVYVTALFSVGGFVEGTTAVVVAMFPISGV